LSQICILSEKTLNTSLLIFGQNDFFTANVISLVEFNFQMKTIFDQFITSVSQQLMETMILIQLTNDANQLTIVFLSNWRLIVKYPHQFVYDSREQTTLDLLTRAQTYGEQDCSCALQSNCSALSYITLSQYNIELNPILPGFLSGCFLFDSLLQSSLVCLYNKTCLSLMQAYLYVNKPMKVNLLKYSSLSSPNTTLNTLFTRLFVMQWYENTSFELYFNECAPQSCQYSYLMQYNIIYVITMLLAVFGGLTKGLHLIVFYAELSIIALINCRNKSNSVVPFSNHMEIRVIEQDNNDNIGNPIASTSQVIIFCTRNFLVYLVYFSLK
jgi:hypothetical protein